MIKGTQTEYHNSTRSPIMTKNLKTHELNSETETWEDHNPSQVTTTASRETTPAETINNRGANGANNNHYRVCNKTTDNPREERHKVEPWNSKWGKRLKGSAALARGPSCTQTQPSTKQESGHVLARTHWFKSNENTDSLNTFLNISQYINVKIMNE